MHEFFYEVGFVVVGIPIVLTLVYALVRALGWLGILRDYDEGGYNG